MLAKFYCISVEGGPRMTTKDFIISIESNR